MTESPRFVPRSSRGISKAVTAVVAGAVAMGLLLGATLSQAADVFVDHNNNVTRIENLDIYDDKSNTTLYYTVDFLNDLYFPGVLGGDLGLRLEWERYELDRNDVDLLSVSVLLKFGGN